VENFSFIKLRLWMVAKNFIQPTDTWILPGKEFFERLVGGKLRSEVSEEIQKKVRACLGLGREEGEREVEIPTANLRAAFTRKYITTDSLQQLKCKIEHAASSPKMYPCVPVFQASGFGKSRLICENAKKYHFTLYWCLRPEKSSGYPKRSDFIANSMEQLLTVSF
jgi:hypothetical protein